MLGCSKCELHKNRKQVIIGEGPLDANVMFVGECPGPDEDKYGRPFVGRAGKLLREILNSLGIDEDRVYITNIVKCFPYHSLNPKPEHVQVCSPYLVEQVNSIKPKLIVSLGRSSSEFFLGRKIFITKESGKLTTSNINGISLLPILHPSYVLRGNMSIENYGLHFLPALNFL